MVTWCDSSGRLELRITRDDAECGYHQGQCADDIEALVRVPYIAEQLGKLPIALVRCALREYGAWDKNQLADHDENLQRLLWLACGDIIENDEYEVFD